MGIAKDQRNITMHVDLAARRCLQWWCQRIATTRLYKTHKIFKRRDILSDLR